LQNSCFVVARGGAHLSIASSREDQAGGSIFR
jgi:hypothetical protein